MTNKTDNRLTYRTDYAWCFDNPTLAAAMIDSLEEALQAAQKTIDEQKVTIRALMDGLDDFGGTTPVLLHISRLETKLAAIRDAIPDIGRWKDRVKLSEILNTTNAQPAHGETK